MVVRRRKKKTRSRKTGANGIQISKHVKKAKSLFFTSLVTALITGGVVYHFSTQRGDDAAKKQTAKAQTVPAKKSMEDIKPANMNVQLYYYNWKHDNFSQNNGDGDMSEALAPVMREIPFTRTPIQDTIRTLLKGGLTEIEKEKGFFTELPIHGLELLDANLKGGVLTLNFKEGTITTPSGANRLPLLREQIEKTVFQFDGVRQVQYMPEEIFQP